MLLFSDLSRGEDDPATPQTVDFKKMRDAGVVGTLFRVSNGVLADSAFPVFRANCEGVLPWWGYGVIYPPVLGRSIKQQAQAFVEFWKPSLPPRIIWIDWEVEGVTWQMADEYIAVLETAYPGVMVIVYSRSEYLQRMLPNRFLNSTKYNRFAKLLIHQAHYGVTSPDPLPFGFSRILWQFTDRADAFLYGVTESKQLDMSYFDGTIEQFREQFKVDGAIVIPPVDPDPPVPMTFEERFQAIERDIVAIKKKLNMP